MDEKQILTASDGTASKAEIKECQTKIGTRLRLVFAINIVFLFPRLLFSSPSSTLSSFGPSFLSPW